MIPKNRKPTHPGEILQEEFLYPLSISQEEFARHLGGSWTQPKVSAIINGRRNITMSIALDFADALSTTPEFWVNLQSSYDLWLEKQKHQTIKPISMSRRNHLISRKEMSS